jgi:hypothetical protein
MNQENGSCQPEQPSSRGFLRTAWALISKAAGLTGARAGHAAGDDAIKFGMVAWIGLVIASFSVALSSEEKRLHSSRSRWWKIETAMSEDGRLLLREKAWWQRAKALETGERFLVGSQLTDGGRMLIRREKLVLRSGRPFDREAIVWVIDDDGDFPPDAQDGDRDSDCYVVDFDGDGVVDRMVDYMDDDGDG